MYCDLSGLSVNVGENIIITQAKCIKTDMICLCTCILTLNYKQVNEPTYYYFYKTILRIKNILLKQATNIYAHTIGRCIFYCNIRSKHTR